MTNPTHLITTPEQLRALIGTASGISIKKEIPYVHKLYAELIGAAPFAIFATSGPGGLDASPRGDAPGFVVVHDEHTLLLPERNGNNRGDSLSNIVTNPHVALLFLIPGRGDVLRVIGTATISIDPELLARFALDGQLPRCVVVIHVDSVFFQFPRAIQRAKLWEPWIPNPALPTTGQILEALTNGEIQAAPFDLELQDQIKRTL